MDGQKKIIRRPRRKGYSSLTSNYTADWVSGRGQEESRFDRFSTTASRQRTPYSETSAIGPPCARFSTITIFMDNQFEMRHRRLVELGRKILTRHAHGHGLDWRRRKKRVEEDCLKREAAGLPPIEAAPPIQKHKLTPRE